MCYNERMNINATYTPLHVLAGPDKLLNQIKGLDVPEELSEVFKTLQVGIENLRKTDAEFTNLRLSALKERADFIDSLSGFSLSEQQTRTLLQDARDIGAQLRSVRGDIGFSSQFGGISKILDVLS